MTMPDPIQGHLDAKGLRFAIIGSRFNSFMTDRLLEGALDCLVRHGADPQAVQVIRVPGTWEIPMMASKLADGGRFDALVCVGSLIRGATPHFEYLAAEVTKGLAQIALATGIPIGYGLVTADTLEQAVERSGSKAGNKGWEAAAAAIELADLYRRLEG
jgi:6,7-dimethyl-8-ribityllumazine synthase